MKYTPPLDATDPNASYVDANPSAGIQGSIVGAAAIEPGMREIVKVIEDAGLTPTDSDNTQLIQAINLLIATALGTGSNDLIYPGAFHDFFETSPPPGWLVRNGALIANASTTVPKLYEALQLPANAWKLKTETEWQDLSTMAEGVGGVPYFVLDADANTIKLPDTRGDYTRSAGSAFLPVVGDWHGDAIRNITADGLGGGHSDTSPLNNVTGAFVRTPKVINASHVAGAADHGTISFDASQVVPTAEENRTRAFAMLGCVYVGV